MMRSKYKIVGLIVMLMVTGTLLTSLGFDFVTSLFPGWHTAIFPAFFYTVLLWGWFAVVTVIYIVFLKNRVGHRKWNTYFWLTLIPLLLMTLIMNGSLCLKEEGQLFIMMLLPLLLVCCLFFMVTQAWFLFLLVRAAFTHQIRRR